MSDDQKEHKEEKPDVDGTHINLKVTDGNSEVFFKIKRSTPLKRLMEAFCKRQGKSMDVLRFMYEGRKLVAEDTPDQLDMEDNDMIEAHREQLGGN